MYDYVLQYGFDKETQELILYRKYVMNILSGTQETFEALSHFL